MTILRDITPTKSFRSWSLIDGNRQQQICVQERTEKGLEKNKRLVHRMRYTAIDLRRFRIIYTRSPSDFGIEEPTDQSSVNASRMVLAVADELSDIMNEWRILKDAGDAVRVDFNAPPLSARDWSRLCRQVSMRKYDGGETVCERRLETVSGTQSDVFSPIEVYRGPSGPCRILDPYDVLLIRIFGLWLWRRPLDTIVYIVIMGLLWWLGHLRLPLFCVLTFAAGLPWRRTINNVEVAEGTKRLAQIESLVGWRCSRHIVMTVSTLVLMDFVASALMPTHWQWITLLECAGPPLLIASLLHAGVKPLVEGAPWLSEPPPAPVVEEISDGSFAVTTEGKPESVSEFSLPPSREGSVSLPVSLDERDQAVRARLAPPGPFSAIVWDAVKFADLSSGWVKTNESLDDMAIWVNTSPYSNKKSVQVIVNVPGANVGSLQHILLDNYIFEDKKTSYAKLYDESLISRALVKMIGLHEFVMLTRYKSVQWGVSPFEVVNYVSPANLFTPAQQVSLGLRSLKDVGTLLAFSQCCVHCPVEDGYTVPSRQYEQGAAYAYSFLGLDEADGSLTFRACFDVDPCVRLPEVSQSAVNHSHIDKVKKLVTLLRQIGPKQNICRPYINHRQFQPLLSKPQPELKMPVQPSEVLQSDSFLKSEILEHSSGTSCPPELSPPSSPPVGTPIVMQESSEHSPPSSDAEVQSIVGRFVKELLALKWELHAEKHGITLWTTNTPWSDKKAMKTVAFVPNASLKDVEMVTNDLSLAPKCDRTVGSRVILRSLSPGIDLLHTKFISPIWGISPRDMVTTVVRSYYPDAAARESIGLTCVGAAGGTRAPAPPGSSNGIFIQSGVDAGSAIPPTPKHERGRCFVFGVLAEEAEEDGVRGVWLTHSAAADPGGSLPTSLVNAVLINQLEKAKRFIEFVKSRRG